MRIAHESCGCARMPSSGEEVRVQMQVHNGFSSTGALRRSSIDGPICGSAGAHASLRRFAEGYSFGTMARIGNMSTATYDATYGHENPDTISVAFSGDVTSTTSSSSPPTTRARAGEEAGSSEACMGGAECVDSAAGVSGVVGTTSSQREVVSRQDVCDVIDGSGVDKLKLDDEDDVTSRRVNMFCTPVADDFATRARSSTKERAEWERERCIPERGEKTRRRRERGALVFGEHAPRTSLPVRERIERRGVPKRLRDTVGVDALTEMMERMLTTDRCGKRIRALSNDIQIGGIVTDSEHQHHHQHQHQQHQQQQVAGGNCIPSSQSHAVASVATLGSEAVCVADAPVSLPELDDGRAIDDDDGTAAELSFLVQKCDLEPERKESQFMPYIT